MESRVSNKKNVFVIIGNFLFAIFLSIVCIIGYLPIRIMYPTKIYGTKNLKSVKGGKFLLCNHFSNFDGILLKVLLAPVFGFKFLSKKELKEKKFIGGLLVKLGAIYVDREQMSISTLKEISKAIKSNKTIVVFPEGTRNKTNSEDMQSLKRGIIFFSNHTNAPLVPARFIHKPRIFHFNKLVIGEPYLPQKGDKQTTIEEIEKLTEKMEQLKEI